MSSTSRSTRRAEPAAAALTDRAGALWLVAGALLLAPLLLGLDRRIALAISGLDPAVVGFFQAITFLGLSKGYLVGSAAVAIWFYWRAGRAPRRSRSRSRALWRAEAATYLLATTALAGLAVNIVKPIAGRLRPALLLEQGQYGFEPFSLDYALRSFPSGHSTTAFGIAFALGALWPRWRIAFIAAALPIAASRVAINAHYPGDVLGGALVAAFTALLLRQRFARRRIAFRAAGRRYRLPRFAG